MSYDNYVIPSDVKEAMFIQEHLLKNGIGYIGLRDIIDVIDALYVYMSKVEKS